MTLEVTIYFIKAHNRDKSTSVLNKALSFLQTLVATFRTDRHISQTCPFCFINDTSASDPNNKWINKSVVEPKKRIEHCRGHFRLPTLHLFPSSGKKIFIFLGGTSLTPPGPHLNRTSEYNQNVSLTLKTLARTSRKETFVYWTWPGDCCIQRSCCGAKQDKIDLRDGIHDSISPGPTMP